MYNGAYPKGFADEFKGFGLFEENPGRGRQSGSEEDEEDKPEKEEDRIVNLLDDHLQEEDDGKNKAQSLMPSSWKMNPWRWRKTILS